MFKAAPEAIGNFARWYPGDNVPSGHQQRSPICTWITGSSALMFRSFKKVSAPWAARCGPRNQAGALKALPEEIVQENDQAN